MEKREMRLHYEKNKEINVQIEKEREQRKVLRGFFLLWMEKNDETKEGCQMVEKIKLMLRELKKNKQNKTINMCVWERVYE